MSMFLDRLGGIIDDVDVATFDSDGSDLKALIVGIEPVQSGTGDPSPDNVRPITGHSSVNVIVSPTLNPLDGTITNITLGQTVYGGTLDVLTGLLTITHAYLFFDGTDMNYMAMSGTSTEGVYRLSIWLARPGRPAAFPLDTSGEIADMLCNKYKTITGNEVYLRNMGIGQPSGGTNISVYDASLQTLEDWQSSWENEPLTVCYLVENPQTIQLTGQQIATFLGTNNVWCSSGKIIHLEY